MANRKRSPLPATCTSRNPEIFFSASADETRRLGAVFSKRLKAGDIVYLVGDLGSGKTTFVQGVAQGFGVRGFARSSSFILVNEYATHPLPLYHMDLYRLTGCELRELGLEEYFYGDGVCLIEWADRIGRLDAPYYEVRVSWEGKTRRKVEIVAAGRDQGKGKCR